MLVGHPFILHPGACQKHSCKQAAFFQPSGELLPPRVIEASTQDVPALLHMCIGLASRWEAFLFRLEVRQSIDCRCQARMSRVLEDLRCLVIRHSMAGVTDVTGMLGLRIVLGNALLTLRSCKGRLLPAWSHALASEQQAWHAVSGAAALAAGRGLLAGPHGWHPGHEGPR